MSAPQTRMRRIEILLVVLVLAIVALVLVQAEVISQRNRNKRRPICAARLRAIAQALYIYAQDGDTFPMATDATAAGEMNLFGYRNHRPASNAVPSPTADLWMLVRAGHVTPREFICPQSTDVVDPVDDVTTAFDFADRKHLSYGYVYQYHPSRVPLGTYSDPTLPVAADANPYLKGGVAGSPQADRASVGLGNSLNHSPREGQNVAFVDGHVSFTRTPLVPDTGSLPRSNKLIPQDNIYTTHADIEPSDPGNAPTWTRIQIGSKSDYCLVP